ncbi:MAG: hypothetical protein AB7O45_15930 [Alphaproteobacteria bacterium]
MKRLAPRPLPLPPDMVADLLPLVRALAQKQARADHAAELARRREAAVAKGLVADTTRR